MKTKDYLSPATGVLPLKTELSFCWSAQSSTTDGFTIEDDETDDLF
jgi:hypothetical protein